jgi:excisionase family DNA binding protein
MLGQHRREGRSARRCAVADRLLDAEAVAEMLGVPKTWIYEQSRKGLIPTVSLGRYRRFRREAIEAWIEEQEKPDRNSGSRLASAPAARPMTNKE